jgi:lipid-binding SYLF domain-containing protein
MSWADYSKEQQLVGQAQQTLEAAKESPSLYAILREMKPEVKAFLIVPKLQQDDPTTGAISGSGVLLVRDEKTGAWVGPAFYTAAWIDPQPQTTGAVSDMILVVRTKQGVDAFTRSLIKLGVDVSSMPGPEQGAMSARDLPTDIAGYAMRQGRFVGFSPDGAVVVVSDIANSFYYEKAVKPADIILKQEVATRRAAELRKTAAKVMD